MIKALTNPRLTAAGLAATLLFLAAGCTGARNADRMDHLDVVAAISRADDFSTFERMLLATDLQNRLRTGGPYTIFAPTDRAFERMSSERVAELFEPEAREELEEIVAYHIVPNRLTADELAALDEMERFQSLEGAPLSVTSSNTGLLIEDAVVMQANIEAANGIVHAIDKVLFPPTMEH